MSRPVPPPPPGFRLIDSPSAVPPPPPGFQLIGANPNQEILERQKAKFPTTAEGGHPDLPWSFWNWAKEGLANAANATLNPVLTHPIDTLTSPTPAFDEKHPFDSMASQMKIGQMPVPPSASLGTALVGKSAPVLPPGTGIWNALKGKVAPAFTPGTLDAAAVNKWMDVAAKEVTHGANPGQRLLDENLLAETKAATKIKVDSALDNAGKDIETELKAADAQGVKIDAEHLVKDALDNAQAKLKSPTDATFANRVKSTFDKILKRYPNIDDLSPSEAHALKKELGDSIDWRSEGDDPLNDAFIQAYRDVNSAIKGSVQGMGPLQSRWGDLYAASRNLAYSLAKDVVGKGSGAAAPAPPASPAWNAAKKLAPYAIPPSLYGAYRVGRDLLGP